MGYKTRIKINEEQLHDIVKEVVEEVLFSYLPTYEGCGTVYSSLLEDKPYLIKEGLITSYPTKRVIFALSNIFNLNNVTDYKEIERNKILFQINNNESEFNGTIDLNKFSQNNTERIEIIADKNKINQNDLDIYFLKYGWFCGIRYKLDAYENLIKYIYEKKFDVDVTETVNKKQYLYHICPNIYLNKINNNGLKPKVSSWNQFSNPERIYFFLNELSYEDFINWVDDFYRKKKINIYNNGWSLLRIDVSKLTNNPTFYFDPRMENGVYTMDTISPESIEIYYHIKNNES